MSGTSLTQYRATVGTFMGGISSRKLYNKNNRGNENLRNVNCATIKLLLIILMSRIIINSNLDYETCGTDNLAYMILINSFLMKVVLYHINMKMRILNLIWYLILCSLHLLSGDIHPNPGPDNKLNNLLSICHVNIRSLNNAEKIDHIQAALTEKYDIITISETWLKNGIDTNYLTLPGYHTPVIKNRIDNSGYGGVLTWISDKLYYNRILTYENNNLEILWTEIRSNTQKLLIGNVYRPPNSGPIWWEEFQTVYNAINEDNIYSTVIILGDFNAHFPSYEGTKFLEFINNNNLNYHINSPTRITETSAKILDQILSNCCNLIDHVEIEDPVSFNDHCTVGIWLKLKTEKHKCYNRRMWNFKEMDTNKFQNCLSSIDFSFCDQITDIDSSVEAWTNKVYNAALSTIPNKLVQIRPNDKPWFNGFLRRLLRKKNRLYKRAKTLNTTYFWDKFRKARNTYFNNCKRIRREYESTKYTALIEESKRNNKKWWLLLKNCMGITNMSSEIPPLKVNDNIFTNDKDKAEVFNNYFTKICDLNLENAPDLDMNNAKHQGNILENIEITNQDVIDQLKNLDVTKAYGLDNISPRFLKLGYEYLHDSITKLFNYSLRNKIFPTVWKLAYVTPLYKKNNPSEVGNYRPVSILNTLSKVFEKIIFKYMYNFFIDENIISPFQSGFLPGFSTISQLIEIHYKLAFALENKKETRMVFLDISKAFDRVWHHGLIYKLKGCGIEGNLLEWIENYLFERKQCVKIKGVSSDLNMIKAGVPQGSVLGPLLFLIFINDLTKQIDKCNIRLFADDTCLFSSSTNRNQIAANINHDLNKVQQWATFWQVEFGAHKSKVLNISNRLNQDNLPQILLNDTQIENVQSHKHLGIILDTKLSWSNYVDYIHTKCMKRLDIMKKLKYKIDRRSLETIYKCFIRPIIEYGNFLYVGAKQIHLNKISYIEKEAERLVTGATKRCSTILMESECGWNNLANRRTEQCLLLIYKIINNLSPMYLSDILTNLTQLQNRYSLRNNDLRLPLIRLDVLRNSFFPLSINLWNQLPNEIKGKPTYTTFKSHVKKKDVDKRLFYFGKRYNQIIHARMRMGCSALNSHLFYFLRVIDSPQCRCGFHLESPSHFFLHCPNYAVQRVELLNVITNITDCNINTILFGDKDCSYDQNIIIFSAVHKFIENSNRFKLNVELN